MAVLAVGTLLIGLVFTIGLYLAIQAETSEPRVVDRSTAEREAMAKGGGDEEPRPRDDETGTDRESGDEWGYSRLEDDDR